jgi:hypothetical protein
VSPGAYRSLSQLTASPWYQVGINTAEAYACHHEWLFRRVETIEFVGRRSVKRSVSVDFEVPKQLPDLKGLVARGTRLVPISVLQKWPPLMDFKLTDPQGHPASLYLRTTNRKLDFGLLCGMADRTLEHGESMSGRTGWKLRRKIAASRGLPRPERLSGTLRSELAAVVQDPMPTQKAVADAVNHLGSELEAHLGAALEKEQSRQGEMIATDLAATVDLAARLAGSSILWVPVEGDPGTDRIVRFSYLGSYGSKQPVLPGEKGHGSISRKRWRVVGWGKWLAIRCSWRARTVSIPLLHAGRQVRYHLDVRAPQAAVELVQARALVFPAATPDHGVQQATVRSVSSLARRYKGLEVPDEWVGPESGAFYMDYGKPSLLATTADPEDESMDWTNGSPNDAWAEIVDRRAHVYLGAEGAPSHRVHLQVKLAAPRQGFIRGCAISAFLITVLMWGAYVSLSSAADHLEATAVLLSVVPVVLGYVLVRPSEQELERYHVTGVRGMAVLSGGMPIVGALTLVFSHGNSASGDPDLDLAQPIWLGLAILSAVLAICLLASFIRAAPPKEPNEGAIGGSFDPQR